MGQANSKQDTGAVSDENRLVYPIGGGHVGEGPVYVNPIAEGSQQQQLPSAQEKPGQLQSEAGSAAPASSAESHSKEFPASGPAAISNPVFEDNNVPASTTSPTEGLNGTSVAPSKNSPEGQSKGAVIPSSAALDLPAAEETAAPSVETANSPVREKAGGDGVVAPKTPEGVVPPATTAKHGPLYSSMPTYVRLGSEEPVQTAANGQTGSALPGQSTTNTYSSSSKAQESSSSSSHHIVRGSSLPELKTEQPLQAENSLDRPPAPPNTPLVPNTSEIMPDEGLADSSLPPGKSIKGGLSSSERGISKAALDASKDLEKPVAGSSSLLEAAPKAAAVEEAAPAAEEARPAVEKAAPAVATTNAPVKTRPLTQTPAPAKTDAPPLAAATPGGVKKMGNTGSLVAQEDKIHPGCLCFAPPGSKKGKKQETIGTDAPIYTGPAATGVAIGGGSLYDAKAAEPVPAVAASTTAQPATTEETVPKSETATEETVPKSETASDAVPPLVEEDKVAPATQEPASKAADPIPAGALSTTSPDVPTKIDASATATPATADPAATTSRDDIGSSATAVPILVPVAIPASESTHHNNLTEEEAAVLPPLKETSDLTQATPGSTAVVGGVASLPAEEGTTSRAGPIAEQPPAAEPGIAGGAVLPQEAGAAHEREAAPVYEKPTSTVGGEQLDGQAASPSIGASEGSIQKDAPLSYESEAPVASSEAATSAVASPAASSLKAPETETAAAPGSALEAPLSSKPSPKKAVSFKEDSLPPVSAIAAETPAVAEKDAEPHTSSTAEIPPATTEPHAAEEAPESILLTPIQETNLTKSGGSLEDAAPAESGYLSSADISEMPGIGRSIPATPEAEAGSVLVGGAEEPKTLTKPEEQIIDSQEQALSASKSQGNYAQEQDLPSTSKGTTAASPSAGVSSAESPITNEGAAEEATGSALAAGASAGAVTAAAAAAPVGRQLSAKQSRKLEKQASKREATARAQALKEKEKADKARFKEKRKEERAHKKEQAKRMQQERQQAGTGGGGGKTTVGVFGFFSRPKKEEKKEEGEKSVTPESQAVGDAGIAAGPSNTGRGAAGAGLSGPANALGASGTSRSDLGTSADPSGVETGSKVSGYLASQGIATEGESSRAPEGTPEVVSLEDAPATAEGPSTEVAPTEPIAKGPAIPSQVEEPISRAESEPEISPLPVSSPEPVPSSSRAIEEPASPQDVAVVFAQPHAAGESTPTKDAEDVEAPALAPTTPPQDKDGESVAGAGILAAVIPKKKKEKKPKVKKVKTNRNIDYSAIQMQKVPESKLQDGFNPVTGQYDTTQGKRVAPGAFTPLRTSQPVVEESAKLARQDTLRRKKSRKMSASDVTPLLPSRTMAPAGRGIERPEASANKADYRPLSKSFA